MAQLDIFGLPVAVERKGDAGPRQGLLIIDHEATTAQARHRDRLHRALTHFTAGVALLWRVDLQAWSLPPLTPDELQDALHQCRGLRRSLEEIESRLEDATT